MGTTAPIAFEIDEEFRGQIPPLSPPELCSLEENLIAFGCLDPLVVWKEESILLDGHNRYDLCEANGIEYAICEISLPDREAAFDWIDRNQFGRRNLTADQMSLLRGRIYNRVKKANGQRGPEKPDQNDQAFGTAEKLADEHGVSAPTIRRDGQYAAAVEKLGIAAEVNGGEIQATKQDIVAAAKDLPDRPTKTQMAEAVESLTNRPHVTNNSGNNEWYTPAVFIASAKEVMGGIDTDPASSKAANKIVGALRFFDIKADGLQKEWPGRVWLNPPYASALISEFTARLIHELSEKRTSQAIVLVNNATETVWFQSLASQAVAVCFPSSRIKFLNADGIPANSPLQGQAFLYFGKRPVKFIDEFSQHGVCFTCKGL